MARYILKTKYNGHEGALLVMCLLRDDNTVMHVGLRDNASIPLDEWVAVNVAPVITACPITPTWLTQKELQGALREFLGGDENIVIVTDWPDDVAYFCRLLITEPGKMLAPIKEIPRITFKIERLDIYPTEVEGAIENNCYWDTFALRHKLDFPNGVGELKEKVE